MTRKSVTDGCCARLSSCSRTRSRCDASSPMAWLGRRCRPLSSRPSPSSSPAPPRPHLTRLLHSFAAVRRAPSAASAASSSPPPSALWSDSSIRSVELQRVIRSASSIDALLSLYASQPFSYTLKELTLTFNRMKDVAKRIIARKEGPVGPTAELSLSDVRFTDLLDHVRLAFSRSTAAHSPRFVLRDVSRASSTPSSLPAATRSRPSPLAGRWRAPRRSAARNDGLARCRCCSSCY